MISVVTAWRMLLAAGEAKYYSKQIRLLLWFGAAVGFREEYTLGAYRWMCGGKEAGCEEVGECLRTCPSITLCAIMPGL